MTNGELSTVVDGVEKLDATTLLKVISSGDCSGLSDKQKVAYYAARCEAAGLDPRSRPFEYVNLGGKLVLYANKAASDQLAGNHGIKTEILSQTTEAGIRTVHVRATSRDGKVTEDIGCVSLGTSTGDQLGNAMMKAVTKAKRRAILSLIGLGLPDETEIETIPTSSAPPSLPMPRRKSEPKPVEAVGAVTEPPKVVDVEKVNADLDRAASAAERELDRMVDEVVKEPLVMVDEASPEHSPLDDADKIHAQILAVSVKSGGTGNRKWTLTGVKYQNLKTGEQVWANTFDTDLKAVAEKAKAEQVPVLLTVKPSEKYPDKFDLDTIVIES